MIKNKYVNYLKFIGVYTVMAIYFLFFLAVPLTVEWTRKRIVRIVYNPKYMFNAPMTTDLFEKRVSSMSKWHLLIAFEENSRHRSELIEKLIATDGFDFRGAKRVSDEIEYVEAKQRIMTLAIHSKPRPTALKLVTSSLPTSTARPGTSSHG